MKTKQLLAAAGVFSMVLGAGAADVQSVGPMGSASHTRPPQGPELPTPNGTGVPTEGTGPELRVADRALDAGTSVSLPTGEVVCRATDISVPGKGMDFQFRRSYRSQVSYGGPLGWNWSHNWDERVLQFANEIWHVDGERLKRDTYNLQYNIGSPTNPVYGCGTPGMYRKLRRHTNGEWQIRERDGRIRTFHPLDGTAKAGRLKELRDAFGNRFACEYDAAGRLQRVLDTLQRPFTFSHDAWGHLLSITDFSGRVTRYAYSAGNDLASVTFPAITGTPVNPVTGLSNDFPEGRILRLSYSTPEQTVSGLQHNLRTVTTPRESAAGGAPVITIAYAGDKAKTATVGAGTHTFSYATANLPPGEAAVTTALDRKGNRTDYGFDVQGHLLRKEQFAAVPPVHLGGPASYVTRYAWDAWGQIGWIQNPNEDSVDYWYNAGHPDLFQRGNLLARIHHPSLKVYSTAKTMLQSFRYDPVSNRRLPTAESGIQDILDYQEGNPATTGLQTLIAQWAIDASGIPLGLGERNGDGTQAQIGGNVIVETSPLITVGVPAPVTITVTRTYDAAGRLLSEASGEGRLTACAYHPDAAGGLLAARVEDMDPGSASAPPNGGAVPHASYVAARTEYEYDAVGNPTRVTDPRGVRTKRVYDAAHRLVREIRGESLGGAPDPDLAVLAAYAPGLATPRVDTYFQYDANGNRLRVDAERVGTGQDGDGWQTATYAYDLENRMTRETREIDGAETAVTLSFYDANGNLSKRQHPERNHDEWVYDERDLLFKTVLGASDPAQKSETVQHYTPNGLTSSVVDPLGRRTLYLYDGRDRLVEQRGEVGTQVLYFHDGKDNLSRLEYRGQLGGPSPQGNSTTGNVLLSELDFVHDEIRRQVETLTRDFVPSAQGGAGFTWLSRKAAYDRDGNVVKQTDEAGNATTYAWDGLGRLASETDPLGNVRKHDYDACGNLIRTTLTEAVPSSAGPLVTRNVFDALGRLVRSTNPAGETRYAAYSSLGDRVAKADAKGPLVPDPLGLVPGQVNLAGNTRRFVFDGLGRMVHAYADLYPGGAGSGANLLAAPFDPSAPLSAARLESSLTYDANGNILSAQTGEGAKVAFLYDDQDRLVRKTFPDGTFKTWSHFGDGSVKDEETYAAAGVLFRRLSRAYDGAGRNTQVDVVLPPGSALAGTARQTFQYDGLGRTTKATDDGGPGSLVTRKHDSRGFVVEEGQDGRTVAASYDAAGRRQVLTYPTLRQVVYGYDPAGRLDKVTENAAILADHEYYGIGKLRKVVLASGKIAQSAEAPKPGSGNPTGYDKAGRIQQMETLGPSQAVESRLSYLHDRAGNRLSEERQVSGVAKSDAMAYDSGARLLEFRRNGDNLGALHYHQVHDYLGESVWRSLEFRSDAGQTVGFHPFQPKPAWDYASISGKALAHDAAGNRTSDAWFTYVYDAFDRLVRIREKGGAQAVVLEFAYDAEGRRIRKTSPLYGTQQRFVYEGLNLIEERDGSDAVRAQYVHGAGVDSPLQMRREGIDYYLLRDALGSAAALANAAGSIVERYTYGAFGEPAFLNALGNPTPSLSSPFKNPFLFTLREYDPETAVYKAAQGVKGYFPEWAFPTGQYFFRARYQDPAEGRFTGRDPLAMGGNSGLDPRLLARRMARQGYLESPYVYVGNNPRNRVDPLGLQEGTPPPGSNLPVKFEPKVEVLSRAWDDPVAGVWSRDEILAKSKYAEDIYKAAWEGAEEVAKKPGFLKSVAGKIGSFGKWIGGKAGKIKGGGLGLSVLMMEPPDDFPFLSTLYRNQKFDQWLPMYPGGVTPSGPATPGPAGPPAPGPAAPGIPIPSGPATPGPKGPDAPGPAAPGTPLDGPIGPPAPPSTPGGGEPEVYGPPAPGSPIGDEGDPESTGWVTVRGPFGIPLVIPVRDPALAGQEGE